MASIFTTARSTFSISTTNAAPGTFDGTGYAALTFAQVCPLETLGTFGTAFDVVTFDDICSGNRQKIKGINDNGDLEVVFAYDDTNAGQGHIETAAADTGALDWHFKVTLPNKQTIAGDDAVIYFSGKVVSNTIAAGGANDVVKRNVTIAITKPLVIVDSTDS